MHSANPDETTSLRSRSLFGVVLDVAIVFAN
jgi:hypothetical protein